MPALTRQQIGQLFRPQSAKALQISNAWTSGGRLTIAGPLFDLSVPSRGLRLKFSGRDVIGTAAMTSVNPMGYANLISRILITGRNARAGGENQTLFDLDLPSWMLYQALVSPGRPSWRYTVEGVTVNFVGYPIANSNLMNGALATYDFKIVVNIPFYPPRIADSLKLGYFLRNQEWGDSVQITIFYGTVTAGGTTDSLGVEAATTTHTLTSFGSAAGSPQVDVYSLPAIPGLDLDPHFVPGFCSRVGIPVTSPLQAAGGVNQNLATLQKQRTLRVVFISGVSTVTPAFASFNDTNLSSLGMFVGNRVVRETNDVDAHKHEVTDHYVSGPIQGVTPIDFIQSGNPDGGYHGEEVGAGATFQLRGATAGLANSYGIVLQEIELYHPDGALYVS